MPITNTYKKRILQKTGLHIRLCLFVFFFTLSGCSLAVITYEVTTGAIKTCIWAVKGAYELTAGATKLVYKIGEYTFEVVRAPKEATLTHEEIDSIDGLPVKEAIRLGRVKNAPYVVKGRPYYPMSLKAAETYSETGVASWYGEETLKKKGGFMTANGETFDPKGLTAAHKYLPLPYHVQVTNLENSRSIIVRVNDRGPFPGDRDRPSGDGFIELSIGAAKQLGFYEKGTAMIKVQAIQLKEDD
jgi:rare lipoprotein A